MKKYFEYEDIKTLHSYAFDLNEEELTNLFNKQLDKFKNEINSYELNLKDPEEAIKNAQVKVDSTKAAYERAKEDTKIVIKPEDKKAKEKLENDLKAAYERAKEDTKIVIKPEDKKAKEKLENDLKAAYERAKEDTKIVIKPEDKKAKEKLENDLKAAYERAQEELKESQEAVKQLESDIQLTINYIKDFANETYSVSTEINEKIFNWLIFKPWNLETFEQIEKCYELINDKNSFLGELEEFADENNLTSFSDFCIEEEYEKVEDLLEIIDEDLKENGLETKYHFDLISDLNKRDESDYVRINAYYNDFSKIKQADGTEIEEVYDDKEIKELYKHYIIEEFVNDLNN
ncbi:Mbov_0392 family ICE element protein [Mycoplasma capricolum]|uniref:Mbov_0392 family ICE element protein n=1 Tax=Mycoplasma capricolum TaxID=2095 RepID=UPI003DA66CA3